MAPRTPYKRHKYQAKTEDGTKVFVRYPNRKFYDLEKHRYVSLLVIINDYKIGTFKILEWQTGKDITDISLISALTTLWTKQPDRFIPARDALIEGFREAV